MKTVGIVGGIASGKSTVAREFARLGAEVLNADEVAHRVLDEPEVCRALVGRWGDDIIRADGGVDRTAISRKVFGRDAPEAERRFLEGVIHPRVRRELERQMEALLDRGVEVVVLDVPLLVEVGWDDLCDRVYFVDAPRVARLRRAEARGWSASDLDEREAAQFSVERKAAVADGTIANMGTLQDLQREVERRWRELTSEDDDA